MILIHLLLVAAVTSAANYPHRRSHNSRKTKINNDHEYNLDESQYRVSRQYIPIHRVHKQREQESISRSDRYASSENDDFGRVYPTNRTYRHNFRKYVTSDEIRPTRSQYSTSRNTKRNNNKQVTQKKNSFKESDDEFKPSQNINWLTQPNQEKVTFENPQEFKEFQPNREKNTFEKLHEFKEFQPNREKNTFEKLHEFKEFQPNREKITFEKSQEFKEFQPNREKISFEKSQEFKEFQPNNYHESLTTALPRREEKYSSFDIDQYLKNPFLMSVLKESPSTAFLPPIEATPTPIQYLPPIQSSDFFSPSPEIVHQNYQPVLIPPNFEPQVNYQEITPTKNILNYNHEINIQRQNEPITIQPDNIQYEVQHLPPSNSEPEIQQISPNSPSENVYLPPKFFSDLDHFRQYSEKDLSNGLDPFEKEEIRKMSFESVKIRNSPSTTPSTTQDYYVSPMVMITPVSIQKPYSQLPTNNEIQYNESNKSENLENDHTFQRRNDEPNFYQDNSQTDRTYNQFDVRQNQYIQPSNQYYQNSIDRSFQDRNQSPVGDRNFEQRHQMQLEENIKPNEMEYSSLIEGTPYGAKLGQYQYMFASERSNHQQTPVYDYDDDVSIPEKVSQPITTVQEPSNINKVRQLQEFTPPISSVVHTQEYTPPISSVVHTQEYTNFRDQQEVKNDNPEVFVTSKQNDAFTTSASNVKRPQEFSMPSNVNPSHEYTTTTISTSTIQYPKDFSKALKMYVEKQKSKPKQEKPVEKKLRQPKEYPKEYPKELLQRSEQTSIFTNNDPLSQYGDQFIDPQQGIYSQTYNYSYNRPTTESVPVLRETKEMAIDGSFHYETLIGDQTHVIQEGHIENPGTDEEEQVIHGSYSFLGDDGKTYTVNYVADSNGFRAAGDHLPTPPPIPEIIQRSIEKNLAEAEKNTEINDNAFKIDAGVNGFRDRSSNTKPIFTDQFSQQNKHVVKNERNPQSIENSKYNLQTNNHQVIQPRMDSSQLTELYSNHNTNIERPRYTPYRNTNYYTPIMEKRSDHGYEVEKDTVFNNHGIDISMNYRNIRNQTNNNKSVKVPKANYYQEQRKYRNERDEQSTYETANNKNKLIITVDSGENLDNVNNYDNMNLNESQFAHRINENPQSSAVNKIYTNNVQMNNLENNNNLSKKSNNNQNTQNNNNKAIQNSNDVDHLISEQNVEIKRVVS